MNKVLSSLAFALLGCVFVCLPMVACSDDGGSGVDSGDDGETSGYESKTLTGFASFISKISYEDIKSGAEKYEATLFELDSTVNLTNREFVTDVKDSNVFTFKKLSLHSPYALLRVSNKKGSKWTWSFVDLSKADTVYVNNMTHIEYERIVYLMKKGLSSDSAQKVAQREVMEYLFSTSFDIKPSNQISGNEKDTVQAITDMLSRLPRSRYSMLPELDTAVFWMLETDSAKVDTFKVKYADLLVVNLSGQSNNPKNLFEIKLSSEIFGRYNGLGKCSSKNDGEIKKVSNSISYYYTRPYECKKDTGWLNPGFVFQDTYEFGVGFDGEVRPANYSTFSYAYDSTLGKWISANQINDIACVTSKVGMVQQMEALGKIGYVICQKDTDRVDYYSWFSSTESAYIAYNTQGMKCDSTGKIQQSPKNPKAEFVCDDGRFMVPTASSRDADFLERERKANKCGDDEDDLRKGVLDTNIYFFCYHGYLDYAKDFDLKMGFACNSGHRGYFKYQNSMYRCDAVKWSYATDSLVVGKFVDKRDSAEYATIGIGSQVWMKENLRYEVDSSWCYNDSIENCAYGRLYQWKENIGADAKVKSICPDGFHVPSSAEWETLITFARTWATEQNVTRLLGSKDGWKKKNEAYVGNDDTYGFSGYPLGYRMADGTYTDKADAGFFCTSDVTDQSKTVYPIFYPLIKGRKDMVAVAKEPRTTCSLRCVKD